jgi:hypothetical protein
MAAEEEPTGKVEKLSEVKVEKTEAKKEDEKTETSKTVNLVNVISEQFGLATFDARDMILSGTVTIDGSKWIPENGDLNISVDDIQGKEIEIVSSPKSVKFTFDSADIDEYRTSPSE